MFKQTATMPCKQLPTSFVVNENNFFSNWNLNYKVVPLPVMIVGLQPLAENTWETGVISPYF